MIRLILEGIWYTILIIIGLLLFFAWGVFVGIGAGALVLWLGYDTQGAITTGVLTFLVTLILTIGVICYVMDNKHRL